MPARLRLAILTPAPDYRADWRWAYDVEAEVLEAGGMVVEPLAWNGGDDLSGFDLILPLVAWGYHQRVADWRAWLDQAEAARLPVANPVPLRGGTATRPISPYCARPACRPYPR